jgi:GNAT superfamily N-acetyltransferase
MSHEDLEVQLGLPEAYIPVAAQICYESFQRQLEPLIRSQAQGIAILQKAIAPQQALIVFYQQQAIALAGLQYDRQPFLRFELSNFLSELGWLKGMLVFLLFRLSSHRARTDEVWLDVLAVTSAYRRRGLGTLLLQAVDDFARQNRFQRVCIYRILVFIFNEFKCTIQHFCSTTSNANSTFLPVSNAFVRFGDGFADSFPNRGIHWVDD